MENNKKKGKKTRLRLSAYRKKQGNIFKYNAARRVDMPCLTKNIEAGEHSISQMNTETYSDALHPRESSPTRIGAEKDSNSLLENSGSEITMEYESEDPNMSTKLMSRKSEIITEGYRMVNFQKLFDKLKAISNHSSYGCNLGNLHITNENRRGFNSKFTFECDMCGFIEDVWTCPEEPSKLDINTAAVAGIINTGGGYTQLKHSTAAMEIPSFSFRMYENIHNEVCKAWEEMAWQSMREAAAEESKFAIECGSVDKNGTPMITVVCDGSWAKRSYRGGGKYNSLSGVAAIVGLKTAKYYIWE